MKLMMEIMLLALSLVNQISVVGWHGLSVHLLALHLLSTLREPAAENIH